MRRPSVRWTALATALAVGAALPAGAARPLLDKGQWDRYFAMFARDANVPWKPATVRLDTYSGAPVDFAAYAVDPAEVIVAGQNRMARAVDAAGRKPVARWRFSPPPGYRFETSDVAVPLGSREGFYVVEARRGDAVQQVWLNRTHIGLVTKENPDGLAVWAVDLRDGRAAPNVTVSFLTGLALVPLRTDAHGLVTWTDRTRRPRFALAESGDGRAFVSLLPQAPVPAAVLGVKLESAAVRAGETIRVAGFVRRRAGGAYRRASGDANVSLLGRGKTLAAASAHLDAAGAFSAELAIPALTDAGDYAVLASAAGGVGGTSVHVDAAADFALDVVPECPCDPARDVPLAVVAKRGALPVADVPVRVQIVRTPHIVPPGSPDDAERWGTTVVLERTVRTDADGRARVVVSYPTDGLDSTYSVHATARGATATARIAVPSAPVALSVEPDAADVDVGEPVALEVRGFDPADGSPAADLRVTLRLSHGSTLQEQTVQLDERGRAHAVFMTPSLGSNLAVAQADAGGKRALDAAAVVVEPSALAGATASVEQPLRIVLDKARYRPGERIGVRATAAGATGQALVTLEGAKTYATRVVAVAHGEADASFELGEAAGDVRVGVALVRDGAVAVAAVPLNVDAPGHPRLTALTLDKTAYGAGDLLHASVHDGGATGPATYVIRIADGRESGPAAFDDAAAVLATGGTTSQAPASDNPTWHAYVAPARSQASDIFAAERPRKVPTEAPALGVAAPRTLLWRVERHDGDGFDIVVPKERGHFVLSLMKISDDGDVGASSASFNVQ